MTPRFLRLRRPAAAVVAVDHGRRRLRAKLSELVTPGGPIQTAFAVLADIEVERAASTTSAVRWLGARCKYACGESVAGNIMYWKVDSAWDPNRGAGLLRTRHGKHEGSAPRTRMSPRARRVWEAARRKRSPARGMSSCGGVAGASRMCAAELAAAVRQGRVQVAGLGLAWRVVVLGIA